MPISDLCAKRLVTIEKTASLQQAARLMKKFHVGSVVVVESGQSSRPVGFITDRDIVLSTVADNMPPLTAVEEVMSRNLFKVHQDEGIASVVDKMERQNVRRAIILDDDEMAIGLVSVDDILQLIAREMNGLGRIVQRQATAEKAYNKREGQYF